MIDDKRLRLLISTAESMGMQAELVNQQGLVVLKAKGREHYLFHKSSNPNSAMANWLAQNKYIARVIFERNNLPNIPFCLPAGMAEAQQFLAEHGRIIVKPLKGLKSRGIHLVDSADELAKLDIDGSILEKFIKGQETRFLVVNGAVEAVHYKLYDSDINNPDTVQRASLEKSEWDERLVDLAVRAAAAIGLKFTAVDFLVTADGDAFLLEINSAPGIERFQEPDSGPGVDIMRMYLELLIQNAD